MKRVILLIMIVATILCGMMTIFAEESTDFVSPATMVAETEASIETNEILAEKEDVEVVPDVQKQTIDFDIYAEQFVGYIFSGSSGSDELMDKIIAMGEQYQASKEAGYTFQERITQLLTPENIITTVAAVFLFVCGIAFFIFRRRQKNDTLAVHSNVSALKKKYEDEVESNTKLKLEIERQTKEISEMKEILKGLSEKSDISKQEMAHVEHTAEAVARMVKDVFLNSKTIDASGKALVVHNYMEALGKDEKGEGALNE